MAFKLVCVLPFVHQGVTLYSKGVEVTDGTEFTFFKATRPEYFVQVQYDAGPAPPASKTWNLAPDFPSAFCVLAVSQTGGIVVAGGSGLGALQLSSDGGGTYGPLSGSVNDVTIGGWTSVATSSNGAVIAGAAGNGLSVSPDNGATFTGQFLSIGSVDDLTLSVAMSGDGFTMIASTDAGAAISTNRGSTFPTTVTPDTAFATSSLVAASRDGSTLLYAWSNAGQPGNPPGGDLLKSTNNGGSWDSIAPAANGLWRSISISANGQTIMAVDANSPTTLYKSVNAGADWSTSTLPAALCLGVLSDNGLTAIGIDISNAGFVWITDDGAATWVQQTGGPIGGVDVADNIGTGQVAVSGNGAKFVASNFESLVYYTA